MLCHAFCRCSLQADNIHQRGVLWFQKCCEEDNLSFVVAWMGAVLQHLIYVIIPSVLGLQAPS